MDEHVFARDDVRGRLAQGGDMVGMRLQKREQIVVGVVYPRSERLLVRGA